MRLRFLPLVILILVACTDADQAPATTSVELENLATNALLTSSASGPGGGIRALVDGDLSTGWAGPRDPYWFEADLGELIDIESVLLMVGTDADSAIARVNVGVHDNPGRMPGEFSGLAGGEWIQTIVGYEARFIRVTVEPGDSGTITWLEMQVLPG